MVLERAFQQLQKTNGSSSLLRQVLERKVLLPAQLRNGDFGAAGAAVSARMVDLTHTEELRAAYNNALAIYLNPKHTPETKPYIRKILVAFEGIVAELTDNMAAIVAAMRRGGLPRIDVMSYV